MDSLEIPYAVTKTNEVVPPDAASRDIELQCPECKQPVILKAGPIRRRHFAHRAESMNCAFAGESQDHAVAKHSIRLAVLRWKAGEIDAPMVHYKCKQEHSYTNSLNEIIATAELEVTLLGKAGVETYRPDVVLRDASGKVMLCIEIYHTHAVHEQKASKFTYNVIELTAADVLADQKNWVCRRMWMLQEKKCAECDTIVEKERVLAELKSKRELDDKIRQDLWGARIAELKSKAVRLRVTNPKSQYVRKIESCPRNVRMNGRISYAFYEKDCRYCPYMIKEVGNDYIRELTPHHVLVGIMCAGGSRSEVDDRLGIRAPHRGN